MRRAVAVVAVLLLVAVAAWWPLWGPGNVAQEEEDDAAGGAPALGTDPRADADGDPASGAARSAGLVGRARPAPSRSERSSSTPPRAPGAPEGTVEGVVRRVDDGTRLSGARVRIRRGAPPADTNDTVLDAAVLVAVHDAETRTDDEGRFSFAVGGAVPWRVVVTSDETALAVASGIGPSRTELFATPARHVVVRFLDGATREPVAGVRVRVWGRRLTGPPDDVLVANAGGRVALAIGGGETVIADAEGYATTFVDRPGRNRFFGPGAEEFVELLARSSVVEGTALLPDGSPAVGVTIRSRDLADEGATLRAMTGPDGRFRLPGLRARLDPVVVEIEAEGFAEDRAEIDRDERPVVIRLERPACVEVLVTDAAGRPLDAVGVVARWPSGSASGRREGTGRFELGPVVPGVVKLEAVLADTDGEAYVAATQIVALRPGEARRGFRFVVEPRPPATLRVRVRGGGEADEANVRIGRADGTTTTILHVKGWRDGAPVRIPPGEAVTVTALPLGFRAAPAPAVRTVSGTREAPVTVDVPLVEASYVTVAAVGPDGGSLRGLRVLEIRGTGVCDRGEGSFCMATDARFRIRATVEGWLPYDAEHTAADVVEDVLVLRMSRGATVRGRVVGSVPPGVSLGVEVVAGSGEDDAGAAFVESSVGTPFELTGLPTGPARLLVSCDGLRVLELPITVRDGVTDLRDVALPPLREVRAQVNDERGRAVIARVSVDAASIGGHQRTEDDGRLRLTLPARVPLVLRASSGARVARPVALSDAASSVRLVVEPRPEVLFRVPWPERVDVRVRRSDGAFSWDTTCSRLGDAVQVEGLPPGSWDVVFRRPSGDVVVRVDAAPGEIREIVVGE